ncbi:MAG: hypothetical protein FOGNACKC_04862 [Anaerolineae bacterium]|nr:hypothetical protein [Anaerolineae bacterium]
MNPNAVTQIARLLSQAGSAHHQYEQTILKGVYDQEWPAWYANYVIEHGLANLLNQEVTAGQISQFFIESYQIYRKEGSNLGWVDYTAQQLVEKFC